MSSPVYRFERSEADVLNQLEDILGCGKRAPADEWSMRAELVLEPVGWDALWRLPKETCKYYGVRFPCVVYVSVEGTDYKDLSASLLIVGVQDDNVNLPARINSVPLIQLWPTIAQPNNVLDVKTTAEFIDLMRFFYTYIWMPWDEGEMSWEAGGVLEARVTLWAAANNGRLPRSLVRQIATLRADAAETLGKITAAEADLPLNTDDCDDSLISAKSVSLLAELHARLELQRAKWTILENPALRHVAIANDNIPSRAGETTLVWNGGPVSQLMILTKKCQKLLGTSTEVSLAGSVKEALDRDALDLLLMEGLHEVPHRPLPTVTIAGIGNPTLQSSEAGSTLLNITEGAIIRDVHLSARDVSTVIVVQGGGVEVVDCRIFDDSDVKLSERNSQGCIVFAGGSLRLVRCQIAGFYTGITVYPGASVELIDCEITSCGVAVQMHDSGTLSLSGTKISKCLECAVRYESSTTNKTIQGGVNLLQGLDNITAMECTFNENSGSDVCIVSGQQTVLPGAEGWRDLC